MRQKRNGSAWMRGLLMWTGLIAGSASLLGCGTKLPPAAPDDTRGCYVAVVTEDLLRVVQVWEPKAQVGDVLISRACDDANTEELLNTARHLSHTETR